MLREIFRNSHSFGKLLTLCFALFVFSIIGFGITMFVFGNSTDIQTLKINQLIISIFAFLLPPIVCGYLWYEKPFETYELTRLPNLKQTLLSILLIFAISPCINMLGYLNEQMVLPDFLKELERTFIDMEEKAAALTMSMLDVHSIGGLLFNLLVIATIPALGEELFCRGALYKIFSEKGNKHVAIWIVAIIFSLIHFQMYGFLPRMVYGAIFGYMLLWSGSLWLPIIAHFINNATIVIASYTGSSNEFLAIMENVGKSETIEYGIASTIVSIIILWFIRKTAIQRNNSKPVDRP